MTATTNRIDRSWAAQGYEIGQGCLWFDRVNNEYFCGVCAGPAHQTIYEGVYYEHWNEVLEARGLDKSQYNMVLNVIRQQAIGNTIKMELPESFTK
jgi:hypothetical protein